MAILDQSVQADTQAIDRQHPWLGLHAFTEQLQQYFFGRESETDELFRRVNRKPLTVLFGQSGLGKTSLLRAGLFPRLRKAAFVPVPIRLDHSPQAPELAIQIIAALRTAVSAAGLQLEEFHEIEPSEPSLWEFFHRLEFALKSASGQPLVPVLLFDQFEEIFTLGRENEALRERSARLLTQLADLIENRPPKPLAARFDNEPELVEQFDFGRAEYRVLLCLREDYLAMLEDMRQRMPSLSENRMRLCRMNGEQALDAVSRPGGHLMSPAVSRQIVKFVARTATALRHIGNGESSGLDDDLSLLEVEPALLSLFCAELNNRRIAQGLAEITPDLLAGSRETILHDYYERCMFQVHPEVRRFIEDELLTESGFRENVALETAQRRLVLRGAPANSLEQLVRQRLLHIEERLHVRRIELTHDVLTDVVRKSRDERVQREKAEHDRLRVSQIQHELKKSRRRLAATIVTCALLISGICGGMYLYLDWYVWPHVRYYNTFGKWRGSVFGIGEIASGDVARRSLSFKITTIGRGDDARVTAMEAVNGYGNPTTAHNVGTYLRYASESRIPSQLRECRWEYGYYEDGRIAYEKALNKFGRTVWSFMYAPTATESKALGHFVGPDGYLQAQRRSTAEYVEIEYDDAGMECVQRFFDRNGHRQEGLDRAYGSRREFDKSGLLVKLMSIDEHDRPMIDAAGNCGLNFTAFDPLGNETETVSIGIAGEPRPMERGYTVSKREYDRYGNQTALRYFDASVHPFTIIEGYAGYLRQYDNQGNEVKLTYIDDKSQPVKTTFGYAVRTARHDELGREVEVRYWDVEGKPAVHSDGNAGFLVKYDSMDNERLRTYLDAQGKPAPIPKGYVSLASRYDGEGNVVEVSYLDAAGKLTRHKDGNAGYRSEFDKRRNEIRRTYTGLDGKPFTLPEGYAGWEGEYDDFGNKIFERYLDASGKPTRHKDGYAGSRIEFDKHGNRAKVFAVDEHGAPLKIKGFYGWKSEYDRLGFEVSRTLIDQHEQPVNHEDGFGKWTATYAANKLAEKKYFTAAGKPPDHEVTREVYEYDALGRKRRVQFFYEAGLHRDGFYSSVWDFDEQGRNVRAAYFDSSGHPVLNSNNLAAAEYQHDAAGNITRRSFYGVDGKPTLSAEGIAGWASKYDESGHEVERRFFGVDGKPLATEQGYAGWTRRFNDGGKILEVAYFDANGKPTRGDDERTRIVGEYGSDGIMRKRTDFYDDKPHSEGFSQRIETRDEKGQAIAIEYLDAKGTPVVNSSGVAQVKLQWDDKGQVIKRSFFGPDGKPTLNVEKIAGFSTTYDNRGNEIGVDYFGLDGKPKASKDGYAAIRQTFDNAKRIIKKAYLSETGEPASTGDGYTSISYEYHKNGKRSREANFFNLKPHADGYRLRTLTYDEKGREQELNFFDDNGRSAPNAEGQYRIVFVYNAAGDRTHRRLYYERPKDSKDDARPVEAGAEAQPPYAYAEETYEHDQRTELAYHRADGVLVLGPDRFARMAITLNEKGEAVKREYFDAGGKPLAVLVRVENVDADGQAAKLKIVKGDVLVSYDGKPIRDMTSFIVRRSLETAEDKPRPLVVRRNDEELTVQVSTGMLGVELIDDVPETAEVNGDD